MNSSGLKIVIYPHPVLRYKSKPVARINSKLAGIVHAMFDLMYEARGVGLAANQVDLPLRLFVMNPSGKRGEGEERVFVNPVISKTAGMTDAEEGCLSLPELVADVRRPERIHVSAFDIEGNEISEILTGYEARIVQHETDHLDGVLFVDRVSTGSAIEISEALRDFEDAYGRQVAEARLPSPTEVLARLSEWEREFC